VIDIRKERPLSIKRAAAVLDVDRRTIERWFTLGLERIKLGGKVYTSRGALYRFSKREKRPDPSLKDNSTAQQEAEAYLDRIGA
jgi:hypothetical protein